MKNYFSTLLLAAILCAPFTISAQVTIGSGEPPSEWSLLDLSNYGQEQPRALHLPRMTDGARDSLFLMPNLPLNYRDSARGLMIFNTDNECVEFWSGNRWISLCVDALPTCGRNGVPVRVLIGNNYYYVHYFMTNGVNRCWMVENSREHSGATPIPRNPDVVGSASSNTILNQFLAHPIGARGYYYVWGTAHEACPQGWSLPTVTDFVGLGETINAMPNPPTPDNPRRFWNNSPHLAGSFSSFNAALGWGNSGAWWSDTASGTTGIQFRNLTGGQFEGPNDLAVGARISVRCIRNE